MDSPAWKDTGDRLREAKGIKTGAYEGTVKREIITLVGNAQVAKESGTRIYYRTQEGGKPLDTKTLKAAHPDIGFSLIGKFGKPCFPGEQVNP